MSSSPQARSLGALALSRRPSDGLPPVVVIRSRKPSRKPRPRHPSGSRLCPYHARDPTWPAVVIRTPHSCGIVAI
jgi:hypothetical protein